MPPAFGLRELLHKFVKKREEGEGEHGRLGGRGAAGDQGMRRMEAPRALRRVSMAS